MKRLLLEDDVTDLERALLSSIALDAPEPAAADRLVAALLNDDDDDAPYAPAVPSPTVVRMHRATAIACAFGIAAGVAILIASRHQKPEEKAEKAAPTVSQPYYAPVSDPSVAPGMTTLPPASAVPSASVVPSAAPSARSSAPVVRRAPPPDAGAASSAPFDKGMAAGALGGVDISACDALRGPSGSGHLTVVFSPDGTVRTVVVDPPFAGTERGGCIAGKYRSAIVPPFGGAPVRVGKSFVINAQERP